jgi:hypothetical protein
VSERSSDVRAQDLGGILDALQHAQTQVTLRAEALLRGDLAAWDVPIAATPARSAATPGRLRASARPIATLVTTLVLILTGWLVVLEPLLGARPVLVTDDAMAPALRPGDIAFAEAPVAPVVPGTIVAVRIDGRRSVTRVIERAPVPDAATPAQRSAAPFIVRTDAAPLEQRDTVAADELLGVVGAAVPRVGLPLFWLRSPSSSPLGALAVVGLLGITLLGLDDLRRERRAARAADALLSPRVTDRP